MDYRFETKPSARSFHAKRRAFVIVDDSMLWLPDDCSLSHWEFCQSLGVGKRDFMNITRGYFLNTFVVFYKDDFVYNSHVIEEALAHLFEVSQYVHQDEFDIYFGHIPAQGFALDYHFGKYINGNIIDTID